jgi:hypothetical protein
MNHTDIDFPRPSEVIADQLEARAIQETARAAEPTFTIAQNPDTGLFTVEIPGFNGAGVQKFWGPDMRALVLVLARAQYHATQKIRRLNHALKEKYDEVDLQFPVSDRMDQVGTNL